MKTTKNEKIGNDRTGKCIIKVTTEETETNADTSGS